MNRAAIPLLINYQQTLIPGLLLFMAGALLASGGWFPPAFWYLWLAIAFISMLACLFLSRSYGRGKWFFWLAGFFLGGSYFTLFQFEPDALDISNRADKPKAHVSGTIIGLGSGPNQWIVEANTLDSRKVTGRILLKLKPSLHLAEPLSIGQSVILSGRLVRPKPARFPGGFDYRSYLRQQKITALLYATDCAIAKSSSASFRLRLLSMADHLRMRISGHFQRHLPPPESEIFSSIVLGEHATSLEQEIKQNFIRSGLIHLLAASGLNVGLIGVFFLGLGKLFRLPFRLTLLLAMAGVGFYCLLTGLPPSVQRAGLMLELAFLLKFVRRELTPLSLLCLTGVILLLINPMIIAMLGFQLSFISTFGLVAMIKPLQEKLGFYLTQWGAGLLLVPVVAQLWVTPVLLYHFHQIQLMSLPANLVALPLAAILTYAGFILGGLSLLVPALSGWCIERLWFVCSGLKHVAVFFGNLPISVWNAPSPPLATIVLMIGFLLLIAYWLTHPAPAMARIKIGSFCLILLLLPSSISKLHHSYQTSVAWLPDWQNSSDIQIIQAPGKITIVNASSLTYYGAGDLQAYLRKQGISSITLLNIISSSNSSRFDGIKKLSEAIPIQQILFSKPDFPKTRDKLIQAAMDTAIPIQPMAATQQIRVQKSAFPMITMLTYPQETLQRIELNSTCIALHWGESPLEQSPLKEAARGCSVIQEKPPGQRGMLRVPTGGSPLEGFTRATIGSEKIRIEREICPRAFHKASID